MNASMHQTIWNRVSDVNTAYGPNDPAMTGIPTDVLRQFERSAIRFGRTDLERRDIRQSHVEAWTAGRNSKAVG
jgi:hypothetical protein